MSMLIVDMQEYFESSHHILNSVISEIRRSKRIGSGIVVLEYDRYELGRSFREIILELKDYPRKRFVSKYDDDGGRDVVREAKKAGFNTKSWRVCGVNTCFCVHDTVETMQYLLPTASFDFVGMALNCNCARSRTRKCHNHLWEHSTHKRVRVI